MVRAGKSAYTEAAKAIALYVSGRIDAMQNLV